VAAAEERLTAVVAAAAAADITKWQESFFHRVQCET
jgi:hypothetical protein